MIRPAVAPRAGAGIEIIIQQITGAYYMQSPLAQGRELKSIGPSGPVGPIAVAPRAGAGIEIFIADSVDAGIMVAPRAGAGIEIATL